MLTQLLPILTLSQEKVSEEGNHRHVTHTSRHPCTQCSGVQCALCIYAASAGQACSIPSTGHVQTLLCLLAQLPLLVQQSHIALSHAPCSYPQTASPCFALQISLSIISTQTLQVRGVFKDSFCAHFDSTSFIPTFTVRRICLQFWAFSELLRWDLWEAGEVPTVPSGSFAPAQGCPDQGFR